jgi:hypothetical protein
VSRRGGHVPASDRAVRRPSGSHFLHLLRRHIDISPAQTVSVMQEHLTVKVKRKKERPAYLSFFPLRRDFKIAGVRLLLVSGNANSTTSFPSSSSSCFVDVLGGVAGWSRSTTSSCSTLAPPRAASFPSPTPSPSCVFRAERTVAAESVSVCASPWCDLLGDSGSVDAAAAASFVGDAPASFRGWIEGASAGSCENHLHRFFWIPVWFGVWVREIRGRESRPPGREGED